MYNFKHTDKSQRRVDFCMTREEIRDAVSTLESLIEDARDNRIQLPHYGICANWRSNFAYDLVPFYGASWDKSAHPGKYHVYPISRDSSGMALWKGNQKILRIELMEYILSNLHRILEDTE